MAEAQVLKSLVRDLPEGAVVAASVKVLKEYHENGRIDFPPDISMSDLLEFGDEFLVTGVWRFGKFFVRKLKTDEEFRNTTALTGAVVATSVVYLALSPILIPLAIVDSLINGSDSSSDDGSSQSGLPYY